MDSRIQTVAVIATVVLLLGILELVRRRRLLERYALLWLFSALIMLALAIWTHLLQTVSKWIGVAYPPNALFVVAFGFVLILLLHFSIAVSKLADQSKILAQRLAILEERERHRETEHEAPGAGVGPAGEDASGEPVQELERAGWR